MEDKTIIYLDLNEFNFDSGMSALALVDRPATHKAWYKFNKQGQAIEQDYAFDRNEMERIVTGPIMLAETPLYRKSKAHGEYFVKFSADTIFKMAKKYIKEGKYNNVLEMHDGDRVVEHLTMVESFFVTDRVKSTLYPDAPTGSWIASFYVEDEQYWNDVIMSDQFNGFSLEGHFIEIWEDQENQFRDEDLLYNQIGTVLGLPISEQEQELKIKKLLSKRQSKR